MCYAKDLRHGASDEPVRQLLVGVHLMKQSLFAKHSLSIIFLGMASSSNSTCPSVRIIIQQCLSARLQVQPPTETEDAQWVEVGVLGKHRLPTWQLLRQRT